MNKKIVIRWIISVLLITPAIAASGQEHVSALPDNLLLRSGVSQSQTKSKSDGASLLLPFFEDFSVNTLRPDADKWADNFVFVNKDFPFNPVNTGAATFDVLDASGKLYESASSVAFPADYLTSLPIRLDSIFSGQAAQLTPADSLYFSFWYQPQGRGDAPEPADSLVLQFGFPTGALVFDHMDSISVWADDYLLAQGIEQIKPLDTIFAPPGCNEQIYIISNQFYTWGDQIMMPCDSVFVAEISWENKWSMPGTTRESFTESHGRDFAQVMIPVTESRYFSPAFRFRFFNYGSIAGTYQEAAGNVDQWNVDFIRLGANRSKQDTAFNKISFSGRAPSFLKRYESMPYKQYRSAPTNAVKPEINVNITNLSSETKNTRYRYRVNQRGGNQTFEWDGGNCNLTPFTTNGFQSCETGCGAKHACPPVVSLFALDFDQDTASFLIRHYISDSSAAVILVDSLVYRQGFYNYFAYDDGTPEAAYSIEPNGAYLAMQFNMSTPDTLTAIQFHFNRINDENSQRFFDLMVWADNNGIPGQVLYRKIRQKPQFEDSRYAFSTYELDEPLLLNGNFYIGIMRESGILSMGFDRVNNAKDYLFYNIDGNWLNSNMDGALMIRAVTGKGSVTSIEETQTEAFQFRVRPNPASNSIFIDLSDDKKIPETMHMFDYTGRLVLEKAFSVQTDVSHLQAGMYILMLRDAAGNSNSTKLIINR